MKKTLQSVFTRHAKKNLNIVSLVFLFSFLSLSNLMAQGTWTALTNLAPDANNGGMLLLSDGTVLCKSGSGGGDGIGNIYNKLTPDANGSYINGTWSSIAPMISTRLYYSSQVLKDGRVYVAGGEYGTGSSKGETYNPLTNTWTANASVGSFVSDANSEILEDGTVLQALVTGTLRGSKIYTPSTNAYTTGPTCIGIHNESAWLKLPDNSILFVDRDTRNSERFIPALNKWVADATLPVDIYDPFGSEQGGALLLPNGKALFIGSTGHNAIYTPSGNNSPGSWVAAADFPNGRGTPDAPAALMVNGKVLCIASAKPTASNHFPSPSYYYEYDYITNAFTQIPTPQGGVSSPIPTYIAGMIDLPNGQVLYADQGNNQYYVYTPAGAALTANKPVIKTLKHISGVTFRLTGTGFNGNSEGATYGDDWQMNTNYPIARLQSGTHVYYLRTFNWNSTGVMRGSLADTVFLTPPAGLPKGTYTLVVTANGISSDPITVKYSPQGNLTQESIADENTAASNAVAINTSNHLNIYPNPATTFTNLRVNIAKPGHVNISLTDISGRPLKQLMNANAQSGEFSLNINTSNLGQGVYYVKMISDDGIQNVKLIVQ